MIGNGKMPYGYVLKHLKLKDTPLYNEVVNARGNLDIKYIASNLVDERASEFVFLCKTENNSMPLPINRIKRFFTYCLC